MLKKLEEQKAELQKVVDKMNEGKQQIAKINKEGEELASYANRVQGRIDVLEAIVRGQEQEKKENVAEVAEVVNEDKQDN